MHAHETPGTNAPAGMRVNVGTLWVLERHSHHARCTLVWLPRAWELRVLIDDQALLSKRCRRQDEVVATAQSWQSCLRQRGWLSNPEP